MKKKLKQTYFLSRAYIYIFISHLFECNLKILKRYDNNECESAVGHSFSIDINCDSLSYVE